MHPRAACGQSCPSKRPHECDSSAVAPVAALTCSAAAAMHETAWLVRLDSVQTVRRDEADGGDLAAKVARMLDVEAARRGVQWRSELPLAGDETMAALVQPKTGEEARQRLLALNCGGRSGPDLRVVFRCKSRWGAFEGLRIRLQCRVCSGCWNAAWVFSAAEWLCVSRQGAQCRGGQVHLQTLELANSSLQRMRESMLRPGETIVWRCCWWCELRQRALAREAWLKQHTRRVLRQTLWSLVAGQVKLLHVGQLIQTDELRMLVGAQLADDGTLEGGHRELLRPHRPCAQVAVSFLDLSAVQLLSGLTQRSGEMHGMALTAQALEGIPFREYSAAAISAAFGDATPTFGLLMGTSAAGAAAVEEWLARSPLVRCPPGDLLKSHAALRRSKLIYGLHINGAKAAVGSSTGALHMEQVEASVKQQLREEKKALGSMGGCSDSSGGESEEEEEGRGEATQASSVANVEGTSAASPESCGAAGEVWSCTGHSWLGKRVRVFFDRAATRFTAAGNARKQVEGETGYTVSDGCITVWQPAGAEPADRAIFRFVGDDGDEQDMDGYEVEWGLAALASQCTEPSAQQLRLGDMAAELADGGLFAWDELVSSGQFDVAADAGRLREALEVVAAGLDAAEAGRGSELPESSAVLEPVLGDAERHLARQLASESPARLMSCPGARNGALSLPRYPPPSAAFSLCGSVSPAPVVHYPQASSRAARLSAPRRRTRTSRLDSAGTATPGDTYLWWRRVAGQKHR